jgi:hypothetical protein
MRAAVGALLVSLLVVAGCSRADSSGAAHPAAVDAGPAFDVETMAFLSMARALHHEANVKEDAGDVRGAANDVERIVRASRPHPGASVPEVEEVLADAWARIAELRVRLGDARGGEDAAKEGLTHAREPTYFRGHLLEAEGVAEEARSAALADAGDSVAAANARTSAMRLLEEAVAVQERVIGNALDGGGGQGR